MSSSIQPSLLSLSQPVLNLQSQQLKQTKESAETFIRSTPINALSNLAHSAGGLAEGFLDAEGPKNPYALRVPRRALEGVLKSEYQNVLFLHVLDNVLLNQRSSYLNGVDLKMLAMTSTGLRDRVLEVYRPINESINRLYDVSVTEEDNVARVCNIAKNSNQLAYPHIQRILLAIPDMYVSATHPTRELIAAVIGDLIFNYTTEPVSFSTSECVSLVIALGSLAENDIQKEVIARILHFILSTKYKGRTMFLASDCPSMLANFAATSTDETTIICVVKAIQVLYGCPITLPSVRSSAEKVRLALYQLPREHYSEELQLLLRETIFELQSSDIHFGLGRSRCSLQ